MNLIFIKIKPVKVLWDIYFANQRERRMSKVRIVCISGCSCRPGRYVK